VPIVEVGTSGGVTWAINGIGMWLTTSGGRAWRASLPPHVAAMGDAASRVQQVRFLDSKHGWLVAVDVRGDLQASSRRHAELDWTSDGGRTWHSTVPPGCCGGVSFVTPERGYLLGRSQLLSTTDGGARWRLVSRPGFGGGSVPAFVDADRGIAVVGKNGLFGTVDGGRHWRSIRLAGGTYPLSNAAVFGRRLVVPTEGFAPAARLVVYSSDDGGASWTARPLPKAWVPYIGSNDANRFAAASADVWVAAARNELAVTTNAGRTWRLVRAADLPTGWVIGAIDFTSARAGWAIFNGPRQSVLMRTTDGGVHWKPAGPRRSKRHRR
jgi:photosystem II stability/assembly factor-like uncharacterized protein